MINLNKKWIWYILASIGILGLYTFDKLYCLFIFAGLGIGLVLHDWIKDMYDNTINTFYSSESRKRQMKKRELEQELEKLNQGD